MKKKRVLVGMSGGIDSSVASFLLLKQGYDIAGATMLMFNDDIIEKKIVEEAKIVANKLGIKHYIFDFKKYFKNTVIDNFISEYSLGRTPNPCIVCNKNIKFGLFLEYAKNMGFDYIATGHYANIIYDDIYGEYLLKKSLNEEKDQSYVLYNLTQKTLPQILFPLSNYKKEKIREIAFQNELANKEKTESQDICFIPDGDYISFLKKYSKKESLTGNFVDEYGNVYGNHKGVWNYTIGQRKGLGVSFNKKMFVSNINIKNNDITLTEKDPLSLKLIATDVNIVVPKQFKNSMKVEAKIRYKHKQQPATLTEQPDGKIAVIFDYPQRAVTEGQSVVFYNGDVVIGGGIINKME